MTWTPYWWGSWRRPATLCPLHPSHARSPWYWTMACSLEITNKNMNYFVTFYPTTPPYISTWARNRIVPANRIAGGALRFLYLSWCPQRWWLLSAVACWSRSTPQTPARASELFSPPAGTEGRNKKVKTHVETRNSINKGYIMVLWPLSQKSLVAIFVSRITVYL